MSLTLASLAAGPSSLVAGPSSLVAGPSSLVAGPSNVVQGHVGTGHSNADADVSSLGSAPSSILTTPVDTENSEPDDEIELFKVHETLVLHGISPVRKRTIRSSKRISQKITRIDDVVQRNLILAAGADTEPGDDGAEIIQQLKDKFALTKLRSERLSILTVLPKSWSIMKIMEEFGVTRYTGEAAKKRVEDKGIFSSPNSRAVKVLAESIVQLVKDFYCHDDVSRVMPGKKDFVSVRNDNGEKEHRQKRLVLSNLKEAYKQFNSLSVTIAIRVTSLIASYVFNYGYP